MLATPLTVVDVLLGHVAYVVLRVVLATVAFVLVGALLGAFTSAWVAVAVARGGAVRRRCTRCR